MTKGFPIFIAIFPSPTTNAMTIQIEAGFDLTNGTLK